MKSSELRAELRLLTHAVLQFENWLDVEMRKPVSPERGKRIAYAVNQLTLSNQKAMRFGLGYSPKKVELLYARPTGNIERR